MSIHMVILTTSSNTWTHLGTGDLLILSGWSVTLKRKKKTKDPLEIQIIISVQKILISSIPPLWSSSTTRITIERVQLLKPQTDHRRPALIWNTGWRRYSKETTKWSRWEGRMERDRVYTVTDGQTVYVCVLVYPIYLLSFLVEHPTSWRPMETKASS